MNIGLEHFAEPENTEWIEVSDIELLEMEHGLTKDLLELSIIEETTAQCSKLTSVIEEHGMSEALEKMFGEELAVMSPAYAETGLETDKEVIAKELKVSTENFGKKVIDAIKAILEKIKSFFMNVHKKAEKLSKEIRAVDLPESIDDNMEIISLSPSAYKEYTDMVKNVQGGFINKAFDGSGPKDFYAVVTKDLDALSKAVKTAKKMKISNSFMKGWDAKGMQDYAYTVMSAIAMDKDFKDTVKKLEAGMKNAKVDPAIIKLHMGCFNRFYTLRDLTEVKLSQTILKILKGSK